MATERRRHYAALEGLRAVAAVAVVVYHFGGAEGFGRTVEAAGRTIGRFGNLGVCLFFVLSGFVLYRPRVLNHIENRPNEPLRQYLTFRVLRIVPAYWLALVFVLVAFWGTNPYELPVGRDTITIGHHIRFFGFLQIYEPVYAIRGLGVAWTLCVEMVFYLTLPAIAWVIGRISRGAGDIAAFRRRQLMALAVLGGIGLAFRGVMIASASTKPEGVAWPIGYLAWFTLGMAVAVYSVTEERGLAIGPVARTVLGRTGGGFMLAAAAFAIHTMLIPPQGQLPAPWQIHVRFAGAGLFAVGIVGCLVLAREGGVHRFLASSTMQFLGRISYGIYLWHFIWIRVVFAWSDQGVLVDHWLAQATMVALLTLASSIVSFVVAEQPVLEWKARRRARDRARGADAEPLRPTGSLTP